MSNEPIDQAAERLIQARSVVILTGAGVSQESGIPTYRDPQDGLWAHADPGQFATPEGYRANPQAGWQWSEARRRLMQQARPNAGHFAIAELERLLPGVAILTQNVDGLHQRAGSKNVTELHGSIHRHKCLVNCQGNPTSLKLQDLPAPTGAMPPTCPYCGAWVRPDIVWFGEALPEKALLRAKTLVDSCNVLMTVGTSLVVAPVSDFPYRAKRWNDAYGIDVNPVVQQSALFADLHIAQPSGQALPAITGRIRQLLGTDKGLSQ